MKVDSSSSTRKTPLQGFDPKQSGDDLPEWLGRRRKSAPSLVGIPWRWPNDDAPSKQRYDAFDAWHDIAMQVIDKERKSFRLMAAFKKVMQWKAGEVWATDEELALRSGCCSARTISRDVGIYRQLGIIIVQNGWRKSAGKFLRSRTIQLAIPEPTPSYIRLWDNVEHIATRGLSEKGDHIATRDANHIATRGLITIDAIEEGALSE